MATEVKVGARLGSVVCDSEVIVVRAPSAEVTLTCGGELMTTPPAARTVAIAEDEAVTLLGKRYADDVSGMEVLCTKGGVGTLRVDGRPMHIKAAKNLPSSD